MTIFLLLSLVLVLSTESIAAPSSEKKRTAERPTKKITAAPTVSYEYDELLLALQWPTSYCNSGNNKCNYPIPPNFTVHGLWLNKNSKSVNCRTPNPRSNLDLQKSSNLRKDLENYWPNLNSKGDPEYLWKHEYEKHGHCFKDFLDPEVYFQKAIDIAISINIGNIMATTSLSSGQTIERGRRYHVEDFRPVTIADRKLILGLRCNYARNSATPQLLEIVFCTYINMTLKNCADNNNVNSKCWTDGGWFQFPEAPAPSPGPSRSPPYNSPHPPHIFVLLFTFTYFLY